MKEITLKNKKVYNIPNNWSELAMGKYIKISSLVKKFEGIDIDDKIFNEQILPKIAEIILGVTEKELKQFTVVEYSQIREALNFINEPLPKFIPKTQSVSNEFKIKMTDLNELKFGTWSDVNHLMGLDPVGNLPMIFGMLVTIERIKPWYKFWSKTEEVKDDEYLDVINNLPMSEIFAINNFFLLTMMVLKQNILSSSAPAEMKVQVMKQFSLMDGLTTFG